MVNAPVLSVVAVRIGLAAAAGRASTETPGSASPVASVTVPDTSAVWFAATPTIGVRVITAAAATATRRAERRVGFCICGCLRPAL